MSETIAKKRERAEFGDFQTPRRLANEAISLLKAKGFNPRSIVEPTCGVGNFLVAALDSFKNWERAVGLEIREEYIARAKEAISGREYEPKVELNRADFFDHVGPDLFSDLPEPILVVGNPPWVTSAHLGTIGSSNVPVKTNFQQRTGMDALTGKSNFDISEWMLIRLLEWIAKKDAVLAMLCKTAVARKVLFHAWKNGIVIGDAFLCLIDAAEYFDAAVDACFLVCNTKPHQTTKNCRVYKGFSKTTPSQTIGFRDGQLIADVTAYDAWKHLQGAERYKWRSGIKHDCSAVMELTRLAHGYTNGLGECVDLETQCLFPMLKSSDVAKGKTNATNRLMLVSQFAPGEETGSIEKRAPLTWTYLQQHGEMLDQRKSSIYTDRARFAIFGVGPYSFAPWKVAISGFYKSLKFRMIGPIDGKPVVMDDTINFLAFDSQIEAEFISDLLNSPAAAQFFSSFIFWDAKRPVTIDLLRKLDLRRLADSLGRLAEFEKLEEANSGRNDGNPVNHAATEPSLFSGAGI